jgi:hypothetical protein
MELEPKMMQIRNLILLYLILSKIYTYLIILLIKVNWLVTRHLNAKGRLDPRGGLHYFWCPNKTWTLPIDAFGALKIVKNGIELRKLRPPIVEEVKNSKKQTTECYKGQFSNTQKIRCMLLL